RPAGPGIGARARDRQRSRGALRRVRGAGDLAARRHAGPTPASSALNEPASRVGPLKPQNLAGSAPYRSHTPVCRGGVSMARFPVLLPLSLATLAATPAAAVDWPQFRGVNRDGVSRET